MATTKKKTKKVVKKKVKKVVKKAVKKAVKKKTAKKTVKTAPKKATVGALKAKSTEKGRVLVVADKKTFEVGKELNFKKAITAIAKKVKLTRFHTYVDGKEVTPSTGPETFASVKEIVVISRYDKGG